VGRVTLLADAGTAFLDWLFFLAVAAATVWLWRRLFKR